MLRVYLFISILACSLTTAGATTYLSDVVTYLASDQLEGRKPG